LGEDATKKERVEGREREGGKSKAGWERRGEERRKDSWGLCNSKES
jgi:hypothetical protein